VVLRALSRLFCVHGLRLGFGTTLSLTEIALICLVERWKAREYWRIKENLKFEISSKNLGKLKIRESFLLAMPEKHWLIMRDMKKGFHEDSSYLNGGPDKAFQLLISLRTESTQKHALI